MKLILEKDEVVAILSRHFEARLDPDKVVIRTDPFEIEVSGIPMVSGDDVPADSNNVVSLPRKQALPSPEPKKYTQRAEPDAFVEPPSPGTDGVEEAPADVSPASVMATSKALEKELEKENPQLRAKRAGQYSSTPPGEDFNSEI